MPTCKLEINFSSKVLYFFKFLVPLDGGTKLHFTHQHRNPFAVFVQILVPLDTVEGFLWLPFPDTSSPECRGRWLDDPSRQIFPSAPSALFPENMFPCKLKAISAFCSQRLSRITSLSHLYVLVLWQHPASETQCCSRCFISLQENYKFMWTYKHKLRGILKIPIIF